MTEQEIKAEKARLHDIVFHELAPDFKFAAMDKDGSWFGYYKRPKFLSKNHDGWSHTEVMTPVYKPYSEIKTQPETTLDWTETLIERQTAHGQE